MENKLRPQVSIDKQCEYAGHKGSVFAMTLSEDEHWLFSSGDDGLVVRWDLSVAQSDGEGILRIAGSVYALAHVSHANLLVAGSSSGTIYFIDLGKNQIIKQYARTTDAIYHIAYREATDSLYVLHGQGYFSEISLEGLAEKQFRRLSENNLRSIAFAEKEHKIFIGSSQHEIIVLNAANHELLTRWQAHDNSVFSLQYVASNSLLLSGGRDAHLNVWDLKAEQALVQSLPAHNYTVNDIALSPSGDYFATASRDKTFKIWDTHSFQLLKVVDFTRNMAHTHSVNRICWLKSDNSLISCSDDRRIIRWRVTILPPSL